MTKIGPNIAESSAQLKKEPTLKILFNLLESTSTVNIIPNRHNVSAFLHQCHYKIFVFSKRYRSMAE